MLQLSKVNVLQFRYKTLNTDASVHKQQSTVLAAQGGVAANLWVRPHLKGHKINLVGREKINGRREKKNSSLIIAFLKLIIHYLYLFGP